MHITLVHVHVKPEHIEEFLASIRRNHEGSSREPGNLRFDVLQSDDDLGFFVLVEIFRDAEAAAAHKLTPHYLAWRKEVADWLAAPRTSRRFHMVAPRP
jgi:autoinducer 2-degrading protein